jgi:hypothetical protein
MRRRAAIGAGLIDRFFLRRTLKIARAAQHAKRRHARPAGKGNVVSLAISTDLILTFTADLPRISACVELHDLRTKAGLIRVKSSRCGTSRVRRYPSR